MIEILEIFQAERTTLAQRTPREKEKKGSNHHCFLSFTFAFLIIVLHGLHGPEQTIKTSGNGGSQFLISPAIYFWYRARFAMVNAGKGK